MAHTYSFIKMNISTDCRKGQRKAVTISTLHSVVFNIALYFIITKYTVLSVDASGHCIVFDITRSLNIMQLST